MMNLNGKQIIAIVLAILGVLMISTANLTELFGKETAKNIVSMAALLNSVLASIMAVLTSTSNVVLDAKNQKGVEVFVDRTASPQIAALAVDPKQDNISPAPGEDAAVAKKAEAA